MILSGSCDGGRPKNATRWGMSGRLNRSRFCRRWTTRTSSRPKSRLSERLTGTTVLLSTAIMGRWNCSSIDNMRRRSRTLRKLYIIGQRKRSWRWLFCTKTHNIYTKWSGWMNLSCSETAISNWPALPSLTPVGAPNIFPTSRQS